MNQSRLVDIYSTSQKRSRLSSTDEQNEDEQEDGDELESSETMKGRPSCSLT